MKYLGMFLIAFFGGMLGQFVSDTYVFGTLVGITVSFINSAIDRMAA